MDCGAVIKALLDRRLVKILGKKEEVGRPILYGTTREFLEFFALKDLSALPTLREFHELSEEHQDDRGEGGRRRPRAARDWWRRWPTRPSSSGLEESLAGRRGGDGRAGGGDGGGRGTLEGRRGLAREPSPPPRSPRAGRGEVRAVSERLQKFLARAGVASRRHAEELITAGRVTREQPARHRARHQGGARTIW